MPSGTTYHNWREQTTPALRLRDARRYASELEQLIGAEVSADGKSRSTISLMQQLKLVNDAIRELEAIPGLDGGSNGGVSYARVRRPG